MNSPGVRQADLEERERVARENAEALKFKEAEEADRLRREQEELAASGASSEGQNEAAIGISETPVTAEGADCTIEVTNYHHKSRVYELKTYFLQFGDLVEVAVMGKSAYVTYERAKDAADAGACDIINV